MIEGAIIENYGFEDMMEGRLLYHAFTDIGKVRNVNDDSVYMDGIVMSGVDKKHYVNGVGPKRVHIFGVFDGICACGYGSLASRKACERLGEIDMEINGADSEGEKASDLRELALYMADELNQAVIQMGQEVGQEIGTTGSILLISSGGNYVYVNVGDSLGFLLAPSGRRWRRLRLLPLGIEHTLYELKKSSGQRTFKGERHILVYFLGSRGKSGRDMAAGTIEEGTFIQKERFLLLTDGVAGELSGKMIRRYLLNGDLLDLLYQKLRRKKMSDNASAILITAR